MFLKQLRLNANILAIFYKKANKNNKLIIFFSFEIITSSGLLFLL